jgi:hypothetical protein
MSTPATSPAEKSHIAVTQNDLNGSVYIRPRTDVNFFEIILRSMHFTKAISPSLAGSKTQGKQKFTN